METFGERLAKLRLEAGLTKSNIAYLINKSDTAVESYEEGYIQPDIDVLSRLANIFNVSLGYLALLHDDPVCHEDGFVKEIYVVDKLGSDGMINYKDVVETVYVNREEMHGKNYFGIVAKDNSMIKARAFKGDVFIVRRQNYASNGDVVVAMVDDEPEIVRSYSRSGNIVTLTAEGDMLEYPPVKIDIRETKLVIVGVVKEIRIKMKQM